MPPVVIAFIVANVLAMILLPRRWAALPLLVSACLVTRGVAIELGIFTFTTLRILIVIGVLRVLVRQEWLEYRPNVLDALMLAFGVWMIVSVAFHNDPPAQVALRLRNTLDAWGLYLLFRVFVRDWDDMVHLVRVMVVVLVPIASLMLYEKLTGQNAFSVFGANAVAYARDATIRARGPFQHPILAGTVGAVCLPICAGLWWIDRRLSSIGIAACLSMVVASGSSSPVISLVAGVGALCLWPMRMRMRGVRWAAVGIYVALEIVMNRPAYFLATSLGVFSSSTGWFRARLFQSGLQHIDEWWFAGTDYTRHWMPTGVTWSRDHTDVTNHFLGLGVSGGVLLVLLMIAMIVQAFRLLGRARDAEGGTPRERLVWGVGAALLVHVVACFSVAYFDHSVLFFYMTIAVSTAAAVGRAPAALPSPPARVRAALSWNPAFRPHTARAGGLHGFRERMPVRGQSSR